VWITSAQSQHHFESYSNNILISGGNRIISRHSTTFKLRFLNAHFSINTGRMSRCTSSVTRAFMAWAPPCSRFSRSLTDHSDGVPPSTQCSLRKVVPTTGCIMCWTRKWDCHFRLSKRQVYRTAVINISDCMQSCPRSTQTWIHDIPLPTKIFYPQRWFPVSTNPNQTHLFTLKQKLFLLHLLLHL